jgi:hypothetical protein
MRFRELRIAWSVFWGVATVLLIVLWVRSYWRADNFDGNTQSGNTNTGTFRFETIRGRMIFVAYPGLQRWVVGVSHALMSFRDFLCAPASSKTLDSQCKH